MLVTDYLLTVEIIGIYNKHNNVTRKRKRQDSDDRTRRYIYFKDDNGKFHAKPISKLDEIKIRIKFSKKKNKVRLLQCSECGYEQEGIGQKVCLNCGN